MGITVLWREPDYMGLFLSEGCDRTTHHSFFVFFLPIVLYSICKSHFAKKEAKIHNSYNQQLNCNTLSICLYVKSFIFCTFGKNESEEIKFTVCVCVCTCVCVSTEFSYATWLRLEVMCLFVTGHSHCPPPFCQLAWTQTHTLRHTNVWPSRKISTSCTCDCQKVGKNK